MDLSVVIPAINEADNLSLLLPNIHQVLRREDLSYEVLVIDGGSTDDTVARSAYHGAKVHRQEEPGYGGALKMAFAKAQGIIFQQDHVIPLFFKPICMPETVAMFPLVPGRVPLLLFIRLIFHKSFPFEYFMNPVMRYTLICLNS